MTRAKDISKILTDADLNGTLDVTGTVTAGSVAISDDNNYSFGDGTTYIQGSGAADRLKFITNASEAMRIDSSGNVGIGTASPASLLHIKSSTADVRLQLTNSASADDTTGSGASFQLNNDDLYINAVENSGNIIFRTDGGTGGFVERLRITSAGNVGIGTGSPLSILDIAVEATDTRRFLVNYDDNIITVKGSNQNSNPESLRIVADNFRVSTGTTGSGSERMRIDASGNVGIGITPTRKLHVGGTGSGQGELHLTNDTTGHGVGDGTTFTTSGSDLLILQRENASTRFYTNGSERFRVNSGGDVMVGTTDSNVADNTGSARGINLRGTSNDSNVMVAVYQGTVLHLNRLNNDGTIVDLRQNGTVEGTISVSGSTVSYNAFSGSHWSRLTDNSKPTIFKGTVIETIDEMCDWYQAKFTIPKIEETPESIKKVSIALPDDKSVGDTIAHTYEGVTYDDAVIIKSDDNKHTKCKISDTADSTRVYGVFADWDNDDDTVNDMYVTAVGTHVVRVHSSATVSAGDLLVSNGDGTAKVQDDDIIRSKTIGKVLTNIVQETYDDGSYTVPCALYCG